MKHLFIFKTLRLFLTAALIAGLASTAWPVLPAYAATITVNTTADDTLVNGNCTLREAIIAANTDAAVDACPAGSGADTIDLPAGNYLLTIPGMGEDAAFTGDLDVAEDLTINGAGRAFTTIDAGGLDRVLQIGVVNVITNTILAQITGVTITGGNSGIGAGSGINVYTNGSLILTNSRVTNNAPVGGIFVVFSSVHSISIAGSRIDNNTGGGIILAGTNVTATIANSVIDANTHTGDGGGISNLGTLNVVNSTISGNSASDDGGGIYSGDTTKLYNVTIANNTADSDSSGLGAGGGVAISDGTFTTRNSIISGNFDNATTNVSPDCWGAVTSEGYNLIENTAHCIITGTTTGNITGVSANLGPLMGNGGNTRTHALLAGSPAIDGGDLVNWCVDQDNNLLYTDQRGYGQNGICDIGAYEYLSPGIPTPIVGSIKRADLDPTIAVDVNFMVTFITPVTGVDASDFSLTTSGVSGAAVSGVSGSGRFYTVTVSTGTGAGTIRLDVVDDDTIKDASNTSLGGAGAGNGDYTLGQSYTVRLATFDDVPTSYWSWQWIERLYNAGITGGCGASPLIYCPDVSVTRAQMAVFLLRGMHGSSYNPPAATGTVFTDVPASYWAAAWIEQLSAESITSGCGAGIYCPDSSVTRASMAVFLLKAEHGSAYVPPAITVTQFTDVPISYWAAAWIEQLAVEGITSGCGVGVYCPDSPVTRASMAVFLVKTFNLP